LIKEKNPTIILDSIGGDFSGKILAKMSPYSIMLTYGNLSKSNLVIQSPEFYRS
jgi:hypothetical protein